MTETYTIPQGIKELKITHEENRIVIDLVPDVKKKTWKDYAIKLDFDVQFGIECLSQSSLCEIMFAICKDLNDGWERQGDEIIDFMFLNKEGIFEVDFCYNNYNPFSVKQGKGNQLLKITGDEFLRKLWGIK